MNKQLCKRLKEKRMENDLTQEEMARALNVRRSTYGEYERGKISPPSDKVEAMAKILGTTPQYLYGWDMSEIDAVAEIQRDKARYDNAAEKAMIEMCDGLSPAELARVRNYTNDLKSDHVDFGSVIKKAREDHGMSESDLSKALGTTIKNVRAYEKSELFPLDKLHQLYETLSITYHQLVSLALTYSHVYEDIYNLELTDSELDELYNYAKYLIFRRGSQ